MTRYTKVAARTHIKSRHPGCPEFVVEHLAEKISEKEWRRATLGMAVGITMQNLLRHEMTDYDQLRLMGIDRKVARNRVQKKIHAMLSHWGKKPIKDP